MVPIFVINVKKFYLKDLLSYNDNLEEISGSDFRNALKHKKIYKFASTDIFDWATKNFKLLF